MKRILLYKKIAALILMVAFMLQSFSQVLIMGDYFINLQNYMALCINKDKPEMECNGQCQMAKKMQEDSNNDKNNPQNHVEISFEYLVTDFGIAGLQVPVFMTDEQKFCVYQDPVTYRQPKGIFRPPVIA